VTYTFWRQNAIDQTDQRAGKLCQSQREVYLATFLGRCVWLTRSCDADAEVCVGWVESDVIPAGVDV